MKKRGYKLKVAIPDIVKLNLKENRNGQPSVYYVCAVNNPDVFWRNAGLSCFDDTGTKIDDHWVPISNSDKFTGMGDKYSYGMDVLRKRFELKLYDIVVFIHEDLKIDRDETEKVLRQTFWDHQDLGVLGVYGSELWQGGGWWTTSRQIFSHGQIIQNLPDGKRFVMKENTGFFDNLVCVDGCFMASTVRNIDEVGWKGNVSGWHQYDNDFCFRTLVQTNRKIGVCELMTEHLSEGPLNDEWSGQSNNLVAWFKGLGIDLPITQERIYGWKEQRKKA